MCVFFDRKDLDPNVTDGFGRSAYYYALKVSKYDYVGTVSSTHLVLSIQLKDNVDAINVLAKLEKTNAQIQ